MNANREAPTPSFEMPPQPESPEGKDRRQEKGSEAPAAPAEQAGKQAPAPALPTIPDDIPAADTPVIGAPADDAGHGHPIPDSSAKDSDHIEQEWVNKAKAVIAKTQDDPYKQKHEVSRIKAEYIQKRFGKQVKTEET